MAPDRRPHRFPPPVRAAPALVAAILLVACGGGPERRDGLAAPRPTTTVEQPAPRSVATAPGFLRPVEDRTGPVRLRINSIGVDVAVVPVGVDRAGDMEVPGPSVAGWYRFGPRPGEPGSSVLAAHVDYDGRAGAFFRLRRVAVGDPVEVAVPGSGSKTFTVTDVAQVPKEGLAAAGAFDRTGRPRLALVTCGGDFDRARRSYEDNVVAWAEPVA